ncbi:NADPH:quinone oxidoreductase family protein [Sneathiella marina]|uniref:NADPH:quinone oxidoreductase family protein n=1 Tax=Sneathiella marina TaxID=2950108 RepID=A0ABY4W064_9PROT|nr:NADPH:quinone oxidoreductase family protein [Sneathiella marina]USG60354.1 NADPH:quinone oxidoreductase family protein [Sneathiella marina]
MTDKTSKMAICMSLDGPGAVVTKERPLEPLKAGEYRIRMRAAALNFPDLLMTYGKYQFKPEVPFVLGMEGAGVIEESRDTDSDFSLGDPVLVKGKTGAFAEYMTVTRAQLAAMPNTLTFEEAAAYAVTYSTAHVSLVDKAKLRPGETVLILGAGGGVGQASVEVAKAKGAIVIAAASSEAKLALAKRSGADFLINYQEVDFAAEVQRITENAGADVILDPVGGQYFEKSFDCIAWAGRILIVGFAGGEFGVLKTNLPSEKGCSVIGVRAGEFGRRDPVAGRESFDKLIKLTEENDLKPLIGKRWELHQIKEALATMEQRDVVGKQVVTIDEPIKYG